MTKCTAQTTGMDEKPVMENKTCSISVRLSETERRKIKVMAEKLRVKNSDIVRYAIKTAMTRLSSFHNPDLCGADLLPTMIEYCIELNRHFDLDADKLDTLINANINDKEKQVARNDIELLALCGMPVEIIQKQFRQLTGIELGDREVYQFMKKHLTHKYRQQ